MRSALKLLSAIAKQRWQLTHSLNVAAGADSPSSLSLIAPWQRRTGTELGRVMLERRPQQRDWSAGIHHAKFQSNGGIG